MRYNSTIFFSTLALAVLTALASSIGTAHAASPMDGLVPVLFGDLGNGKDMSRPPAVQPVVTAPILDLTPITAPIVPTPITVPTPVISAPITTPTPVTTPTTPVTTTTPTTATAATTVQSTTPTATRTDGPRLAQTSTPFLDSIHNYKPSSVDHYGNMGLSAQLTAYLLSGAGALAALGFMIFIVPGRRRRKHAHDVRVAVQNAS